MKNLFLLIGFVAAAWFTADIAMNQFGLQFRESGNTAYASVANGFSPSDNKPGKESYSNNDVVLNFSSESERTYDPYDTYVKGSDAPVSSREARRNSSKKAERPQVVNVNEWVDRFTSIAFLEAQKEDVHVPATLSIATGLYLIKQGERIDSKEDFLKKVVGHLLDIKEKASAKDRKAYFQYAANSDHWLEGMARKGMPAAEIRSLIDQYNLSAYDEVVFENLTGKQLKKAKVTRVTTKKAEPVFVGDKADKEALRKHAAKVNEWAESELSGAGHDMSFAAQNTPASQKVEEARMIVASLKTGESMVFEDPDMYELAVRELVALEAGYDSWKAYSTEQSAKARKEFQERHNLMAKGLTLRVTRRK